MDEILNRVAESELVTLNLEDYYPQGKRMEFDLSQALFEGLLLREKEFRAFVSSFSWSQYKDAYVALHCSTDAIVPTWAFMLVEVQLEREAKKVVFGNLSTLQDVLFAEAIHQINPETYRDKKVMVKGCSKVEVPTSAYVEVTRRLKPVVYSLFYGEACSAVPLYKRKKAE